MVKPQVKKSGPVQAQNTKTTPAAPTPAAASTTAAASTLRGLAATNAVPLGRDDSAKTNHETGLHVTVICNDGAYRQEIEIEILSMEKSNYHGLTSHTSLSK